LLAGVGQRRPPNHFVYHYRRQRCKVSPKHSLVLINVHLPNPSTFTVKSPSSYEPSGALYLLTLSYWFCCILPTMATMERLRFVDVVQKRCTAVSASGSFRSLSFKRPGGSDPHPVGTNHSCINERCIHLSRRASLVGRRNRTMLMLCFWMWTDIRIGFQCIDYRKDKRFCTLPVPSLLSRPQQ
jgi:hypothetical protein